MALKKTVRSRQPVATHLEHVYEMQIGNFTIVRGDIIKVHGEYGTKFKFNSVVTNTKIGATWVDCFELYKGQVGALRSFTIDRIKRIPTRRPRRVNRATTN
jgi:hypothetical protein